MQIRIKDTKENETLTIIDPKTGLNWAQDFIGNHGALSDGQFTWDEELTAYVCEPETFEWWVKVLSDNEHLERRLFELRQQHGDAVDAALQDIGGCDLEDHAATVNQALDEAFGEPS